MGKVWKPKGDKPTPREVYGRALAGFADTPQEEYQAYEKAMGTENVKRDNYVEALPPIRVLRRGKWVEPDEGLDVLDFTTDQLPQIPSIVGGIAGFSAAGPQGAVGGAMVGEGMRRKIGQQLGVGDGSINPTAMKIAGAGEVLGPALAAIPLPNIGALTAYHGSPHIFDKFDMSKIGTGEGAQAYGHGLYFAENAEVARRYQDNVKDMETIQKINQKLAELSKIIDGDSVGYRRFKSDAGKNAAKEYDGLLEMRDNVRQLPGSLYTVDIPDEHIDRMLDWDKPLSEQSEYVKNALAKYNKLTVGQGNASDIARNKAWMDFERGLIDKKARDSIIDNLVPNIELSDTGETIHRKLLESASKGKRLPAKKLQEMGIPGIKYLDGSSRTAGQGTRNFVLFDDSIPKIIKRE